MCMLRHKLGTQLSPTLVRMDTPMLLTYSFSMVLTWSVQLTTNIFLTLFVRMGRYHNYSILYKYPQYLLIPIPLHNFKMGLK